MSNSIESQIQSTPGYNQRVESVIESVAKDLWESMHALGKDSINLLEHPEMAQNSKVVKQYIYGCHEVVVECYENGMTLVTYVPTNRRMLFKDRNKAFHYAQGCKQYVNHVGRCLL